MVLAWRLLPYEIQLPVFRGPLDLLLHLIEKEELDISVVSLAQVTEQYLAYLSRLEELEAGVLADFLVVAARLILLKSRALLPKPPVEEDDEEEDPGEALVRQLREYKRFKTVAAALKERDQMGLRAYVRMAPSPAVERRLNLDGVSLADLLAAMQEVLAEKPPADGPAVTRPFVVTVHDKISLVGRLFRTRSEVRFRELLDGAANRVEVVVTLLAILELIKRHRVIVEQPQLFGEIWVRLAPGVDLETFDDMSSNGSEPEPAMSP
ncbi:MAG: segregation/condensation protein A [Anaerolineae bacterium]|nr:segregation/condensation protein A [Anaerolineae bacterium]